MLKLFVLPLKVKVSLLKEIQLGRGSFSLEKA